MNLFFGGFKDQQNHVLPSHDEDFDDLIIFDLFSINKVRVRWPRVLLHAVWSALRNWRGNELPTAHPISLFFPGICIAWRCSGDMISCLGTGETVAYLRNSGSVYVTLVFISIGVVRRMNVSLSWSHHILIVDFYINFLEQLSYLHASSFSSSERMVPSNFIAILGENSIIIFLCIQLWGNPLGRVCLTWTQGFQVDRYFFNPGFSWSWLWIYDSRERSHIPPNGKLGTSSTQKYVWEGIG